MDRNLKHHHLAAQSAKLKSQIRSNPARHPKWRVGSASWIISRVAPKPSFPSIESLPV